MPKTQGSVLRALTTVVILLAASLTLLAAVPTGWYVAGSRPGSYEAGTDDQVARDGQRSAYLRAREIVTDGFGTLMQNVRADKYTGKRVRFRALVKSDAVQDWAGLWMRVDKDSKVLAFDNMQNRPITGTNSWKAYDVVLDVPPEATGIFFGVLLSKTGTVWLNDVRFEVVGLDVPTTGGGHASSRDEPANLNFEHE